jgi:hypothetical protein
MMSRWIKNIECIVPIYQEDMIWFRYTIRCLTTMTELWSANKPSWDTVYQTPKEIYQYAYNRECWYQGKIRKNGWAGSITSLKGQLCRLIMCSCNCALNL